LSPNQNDQINKKIYKDARVHYTILKQQTNTNQHTRSPPRLAWRHQLRHPPHTHGGSPRTQQRATAPTNNQPPTRSTPTPTVRAVLDTKSRPLAGTRSMPSTISHPTPHTTRGCERGRPPASEAGGH